MLMINMVNDGLMMVNLVNINGLDYGKIYRKALYLMVKTKPWFPVNFPSNQSIDNSGSDW